MSDPFKGHNFPNSLTQCSSILVFISPGNSHLVGQFRLAMFLNPLVFLIHLLAYHGQPFWQMRSLSTSNLLNHKKCIKWKFSISHQYEIISTKMPIQLSNFLSNKKPNNSSKIQCVQAHYVFGSSFFHL